jgi:hypothetical protein
VLEKVIDVGELRPRPLPGGGYGVCFTAADHNRLSARCFGAERELRQQHGVRALSGWGVALPFDYARELGIRPVLSVQSQETDALPPELRWLVQPFGADERRDWTYEDEWRAERAIELRADLMLLVAPDESSASQLPDDVRRQWQVRTLRPKSA